MSRQVRRVPPTWNHPRDARGEFIPMHEHFPYNEDEIAEGVAEGWLDASAPNFGIDCMPDWPQSERTHFQMYETTSEGTPISPVCASAEELARWLTDNRASAFAGRGASYQQWLAMIGEGWAPSAIGMPGLGLMSGVEGLSVIGRKS